MGLSERRRSGKEKQDPGVQDFPKLSVSLPPSKWKGDIPDPPMSPVGLCLKLLVVGGSAFGLTAWCLDNLDTLSEYGVITPHSSGNTGEHGPGKVELRSVGCLRSNEVIGINKPGNIDLRSKEWWHPEDALSAHLVVPQAMSEGLQIMGIPAVHKAPLSPSDPTSLG